MKLKFYGAAQCVTGSNYLLETDTFSLLVDCGLFQGDLVEEKLNHEPFAFDPKIIDAMVLTHAHIDHSGRIPKLVKEGFSGKIYCSRATKDLAEILLLDSAKIQEADAEWENKKRKRAGLEPVLPLYHTDDVYNALALFYPLTEEQVIAINKDMTLTLTPTGHLLGACAATISVNDQTLTFSGDLGTDAPILLPKYQPIPPSDIIICETTYGNRHHPQAEEREKQLAEALLQVLSHQGTAIIPAFSVGRTQQILYDLYHFIKNNPETDLAKYPIYVDSPLAIDATSVYLKHIDLLKPQVKQELLKGKTPFHPENLTIVHDMKKSMALNTDPTPKIIISASGMCDAGRIRHHLKHYLWKPQTGIMFVGYQAEGSVGRQILDGSVRLSLLGEEVAVKARVYKLSGYSGHGDQTDLMSWLATSPGYHTLILTHGEALAINAMKTLLNKDGVNIYTPGVGDEIDL